MRKIKLKDSDEEIYELESDNDVYYRPKDDMVLVTRAPMQGEEYDDGEQTDDFDDSELIIYADWNEDEDYYDGWVIIKRRIPRKEYMEEQMKIIRELNTLENMRKLKEEILNG